MCPDRGLQKRLFSSLVTIADCRSGSAVDQRDSCKRAAAWRSIGSKFAHLPSHHRAAVAAAGSINAFNPLAGDRHRIIAQPAQGRSELEDRAAPGILSSELLQADHLRAPERYLRLQPATLAYRCRVRALRISDKSPVPHVPREHQHPSRPSREVRPHRLYPHSWRGRTWGRR